MWKWPWWRKPPPLRVPYIWEDRHSRFRRAHHDTKVALANVKDAIKTLQFFRLHIDADRACQDLEAFNPIDALPSIEAARADLVTLYTTIEKVQTTLKELDALLYIRWDQRVVPDK